MNAGASAASTPSANELAPVDIVAVSGLLDDVVVAEIETAIERSTTNGAQAIVLQVNSRGAVVSRERMAKVLEKISSAAIPVAVWVGPTGARAYGLSAQMLTVADVTAMAPGARIGFSGELLSVGSAPVSFGSADSTLTNSSVGFSDARKLGVLKNVGTDEGVPVVRNMLYALDGLTIDGQILDTVVESLDSTGLVVRDATTARFFKLGLMGQLMHTVASPPVAYLLFAIGLSLLIFEFFTAGIGIAGFVGAVCLVLGVYGLAALPVHLWAVALIVLSVFAFAVGGYGFIIGRNLRDGNAVVAPEIFQQDAWWRYISNLVGLQFLSLDDRTVNFSIVRLLALRLFFVDSFLVPICFVITLMAQKIEHSVLRVQVFLSFTFFLGLAAQTDFNSTRQNLPFLSTMGVLALLGLLKRNNEVKNGEPTKVAFVK